MKTVEVAYDSPADGMRIGLNPHCSSFKFITDGGAVTTSDVVIASDLSEKIVASTAAPYARTQELQFAGAPTYLVVVFQLD